jgi:hypothetical protein
LNIKTDMPIVTGTCTGKSFFMIHKYCKSLPCGWQSLKFLFYLNKGSALAPPDELFQVFVALRVL